MSPTVRGSEVALVQKWLQFVSTEALVLECKRTPLHGECTGHNVQHLEKYTQHFVSRTKKRGSPLMRA
jgi:hypothetical protein